MKRSSKIIAGAAVITLGIAAATGIASASGYGERGHGYGKYHGHGGSESCGKRGGFKGKHGFHGERMMETFDANKDGQISAEELVAKRDKVLADHDADKNGQLSLKEFEGVWLDLMRQKMVRHFQRLDRDGDAQVTVEEIQRPLDHMMARMDRNEDGVISKDDRRHKGWHHRRGDDDDDDRPRGPMMKRNQ